MSVKLPHSNTHCKRLSNSSFLLGFLRGFSGLNSWINHNPCSFWASKVNLRYIHTTINKRKEQCMSRETKPLGLNYVYIYCLHIVLIFASQCNCTTNWSWCTPGATRVCPLLTSVRSEHAIYCWRLLIGGKAFKLSERPLLWANSYSSFSREVSRVFFQRLSKGKQN